VIASAALVDRNITGDDLSRAWRDAAGRAELLVLLEATAVD
jgi:hypothetical protein